MSEPVDQAALAAAARCALCGEPNDCAIARRSALEAVGATFIAEPPPCWCVERRFPASLTDRAKARDAGRRCICRACLEAEESARPPRPSAS